MAVDTREDCYFFLHGGCNKANSCQYRHSEEAKNTINVCTEWMGTKLCKNEGCNLRHSTYHIATPLPIQKDARGEVPCYWELNGGCKKYHCPFKHDAPKKNSSFQSFRPPPISNGTPIHHAPGTNTYTPRPSTYPSHNKTLILNNGASVQTPSATSTNEAFQVKPVTIIGNANPARPPQPNIPGGIQIKNISNGNGKSALISGDLPKTQLSFKSSKVTSDARPQQKSVFERISNFKGSAEALKSKDIITRKVLKTSPKPQSEANDSFSGIKIKTLDEILKEKRRKQGQDASALPVTQSISHAPVPLSEAPGNKSQPPFNNPLVKLSETAVPENTKRSTSPLLPTSKKAKEDFLQGDFDDFGLDLDDMDFNEADASLLEMELDVDFPEL